MLSFVDLVFRFPDLRSLPATRLAANVDSSVQQHVDVVCSVLCLLLALAASGARDLQAGLACACPTSELVRPFPRGAARTECGSLPVSRRRRIIHDF